MNRASSIRVRAPLASALTAAVAAAAIAVVPAGCRDSRIIPIRGTVALPSDASIEPPVVDTSVDVVPSDGTSATDAMIGDAPVVVVCPTALIGYATVTSTEFPTPTTGGAGGPVVVANNLDQLKAYAAQTGPLVVNIGAALALTGQIPVQSDKTLRGVVPGAGLFGGGLFVSDVHNVVIQNLIISKATATDAITIQRAQHIWIDHCDLSSDTTSSSDTYDGLVDITHATDFVTVSWSRLHDHIGAGASLIGHSENNAAEDTGHLTVTYHHNWFLNALDHSPRVRFGSVHVFNNLYQKLNTAVISQMFAVLLVEDNVFQSVTTPITTVYRDMNEGTVSAPPGNIFDPTSALGVDITMTNSWIPPYAYNADSADAVQLLVGTCAGPQFP